MHFAGREVVLIRFFAALCISAMASTAAEACDDKYLTPVVFIGGQGGNYDRVMRCDGSRISKIETWAQGNEIRGLAVTWSNYDADGLWSQVDRREYGHKEGSHDSITFKPDELITGLTLYGNGIGTRLGGIEMQTDDGREWNPKMTDWGLKTPYQVNAGSGYPVGIWIRHGDAIDALGFGMLKPVQRQQLHVSTYPNLAKTQPQLVTLHSRCVRLRPNEETAVEFNEGVTKAEGGKWNFNIGLKVGFKETAEAGLPSIASGKVEVSAEVSVGVGHEWNWSESKVFGGKTAKKFPVGYYENLRDQGALNDLPKDAQGQPIAYVRVTEEHYKANIDTPFEGEITWEFGDGLKVAWPIRGTYAGVAYSDSRLDEDIVGQCG